MNKNFLGDMSEERFDKEIGEGIEEAKKMIKKSKGGVVLFISVPNINKDEFEGWSLGEPLKGVNMCMAGANSPTLSVLTNMLHETIDRLEDRNPEVKLLSMLAGIKNRLTIDEEDLDNYES